MKIRHLIYISIFLVSNGKTQSNNLCELSKSLSIDTTSIGEIKSFKSRKIETLNSDLIYTESISYSHLSHIA